MRGRPEKKLIAIAILNPTENVMHIPEILAWSWTGHGALTSAAVTAAIAQFVTLGKSFLEKRFVEIYKVWQGPPGKTSAKDCLQEMMAILPEVVQKEDIHPANIPVIGEFLNPTTGQVRHFMRSSASVSSLEAYNASKAYIIQHLTGAWSKYREAVNFQDKWYDVLNSSSSIFWEGNYELGKALHTIEDSYAPGHVTRKPGSGFIVQVNIWDDENKNPDPARDWPGHEALDNPNHEKSREFFVKAKEASAALIICVLANLDQDEPAFTKAVKDSIEKYFHLGLAFENDPSDLLQKSDTLPA
ncbi:MAG: hypothetical protein JO331_10620 [Verrucomicrobia bacterium]|nr:hypothetical protein [Verrucomicrobiota bacterium]